MQGNKTVGSGSAVTRPISLMYVVTSQISTVLLKGQPKFLREAGFEVSVVSSPGPNLDAAAEDENVQRYAVPMVRDIAGFSDLVSLCRLWRLMRRHKPTITNVSTPKAGLLGGLASRLSWVPLLTTVMLTLGMTEPASSATVPLSVAVAVCAETARDNE